MSKLKRASITLPGDLKREARAKAIKEGKNLSLVVRELLAEYIKDDKPDAERLEQANQYRGMSDGGGGDNVVAYDPIADLKAIRDAVDRLLAHYEPLPFVDISADLPQHPTKRYDKRDLSQIEQIVVHHVGVDAVVPPERTARYHVNTKDWPGIAYHFYATMNGDAFQTQPLDIISYHCGGMCNVKSIGICLEGRWMDKEPPEAQLEATREVIGWLFAHLPQPLTVFGHREVGQTACPGNTWSQWKGKVLP
jgi:hypothetical protein